MRPNTSWHKGKKHASIHHLDNIVDSKNFYVELLSRVGAAGPTKSIFFLKYPGVSSLSMNETDPKLADFYSFCKYYIFLIFVIKKTLSPHN